MYVRGLITPCGLAAGVAVFYICCFYIFLYYKIENTESDWYTASPYGLDDLQLPHSSDREYHILLSVCYCGVPSTSGTLMHPNLAHLLLTINQQ